METDTGPWLMPVQYECTARAAGIAQLLIKDFWNKEKRNN
jgi:hypothetical protein